VLLSDGPENTAWFEHRLLAREMAVPAVQPGQLRAGPGGSVLVELGGTRVPVDVIYRRLDEDELPALRAGSGEPLDELLMAGLRAGTLAVANAPGNGVGDDKATYAYVPQMITYYLGERPVLGDVQTWVLADPEQYADVRTRLGELVVKPVDGYGGVGVMFGPSLEAAELAELEVEVAKAPHRFIAQRPIPFSTLPTLVDGRFDPRHVDLRVFALTGLRTTAVPHPLSRVALEEGSLLVNSSQGGGSKDTWLV
jgi:carboxylate-amine ligase